MSYVFQWKNPALPGKSNITVNVASTVSTAASITFTGKGSANYGQVQQTNLMRLLENFADSVAPAYPTIGQTWFDSANGVLSVCTSISPVIWETLAGVQVTAVGVPPVNPSVGDLWFERFSHSGFLYVFTGTGRYPSAAWNAHTTGYYPPVSPLVAPYLNVKLNFDGFSTPNFNEAYIHGFTGSTPTDTDGQIKINGVLTNVPRGPLFTNYPNVGFIVWDTTSTLTSTVGPSHFFSCRSVGDHKFEYDNNTFWVPFTPAAGMYVIGLINVAEADDQTAPGIASGEVWTDAIPLTSSLSVPPSTGTGAAGGWHQIWPAVEHHGARFEYDALAAKVLQLIGSPFTTGGNWAARGLALTNFEIVDASINAAAYVANRDINVGPLNDATFVAGEPTADDWDRLLAAARWAINRLDLPVTMVDSISRIPFTQDGRVATSYFQTLSRTDIRYPVEERRYFRRYGSITGARLYAETMNVLNAATTQRYVVKGIAGQNSTITTFSPDTARYQHSHHQGVYTGGGSVFHFMRYHSTDDDQLGALLCSGAAIDVKLDYTLPGSPTANDTTFKSFIDTNNLVRITNDKVRVFSNSGPLALSQPPVSLGFVNAGQGSLVNVATFTAGASSVTIALQRDYNTLTVRVAVSAPNPIGGTLAIRQFVVRDAVTYGVDVPFFPRPALLVAGTDDAGTDVALINQPLAAPPVVNFSASATVGGAPLLVNFTYTGSGSPSLVEWDFTGDGIFDATGLTPSFSYTTPGTYMVRARATNSTGQDVLTRPTYIVVS